MSLRDFLFSLAMRIAVALVWLTVAPQHAAAQCADGFLQSITVSETGGQSVPLYSGVSSTATDGLDEAL